MNSKQLNINCPINRTGYGIASTNIVKALGSKINLSLFPLGSVSVDNRTDHALISAYVHNSQLPDPKAPTLKIWHQFDLLQRIGNGKYYAMPFFELDTFNVLEKIHLSCPDTLFVTSEWAKEVIANNNITTTTEVVPLGVDRDIFNPNKITKTRSDGKYVFLNIGKWEIRKGHDFLLEIFNKAFPSENDVELWILASESTNSYSPPEEIAKWKSMYNNPRVKLFSGVNAHAEIAYLIAESDCGLYPSRAEGWNMELLESMSMDKPVICTNYSAHTEFCNRNNSFLVNITEVEPAFDGKAFKRQGNWAKITNKEKDQMIDYMRYCYSNRITTNSEGVKTAEEFSWKNSAEKIMGYIP
jgi:glycosyltransferase involved in cell wall biosynthesis